MKVYKFKDKKKALKLLKQLKASDPEAYEIFKKKIFLSHRPPPGSIVQPESAEDILISIFTKSLEGGEAEPEG